LHLHKLWLYAWSGTWQMQHSYFNGSHAGNLIVNWSCHCPVSRLGTATSWLNIMASCIEHVWNVACSDDHVENLLQHKIMQWRRPCPWQKHVRLQNVECTLKMYQMCLARAPSLSQQAPASSAAGRMAEVDSTLTHDY